MITTSEQTIPCPVCGTKIPFDTNQLLLGILFKCPSPGCDASIGLPGESKPIVEETMNKFNELKRELGRM